MASESSALDADSAFVGDARHCQSVTAQKFVPTSEKHPSQSRLNAKHATDRSKSTCHPPSVRRTEDACQPIDQSTLQNGMNETSQISTTYAGTAQIL